MSAETSNKQLSPEDQQAVDFALNRQEQPAGFVTSEPSLGQRVQAVEKHLQLLAAMPEEPMPKNLIARVMERIADPDAARTTAPTPQDFIQQQQHTRGNQA